MEEVPTYFAMDITDLFRTHVLHDSAATMWDGVAGLSLVVFSGLSVVVTSLLSSSHFWHLTKSLGSKNWNGLKFGLQQLTTPLSVPKSSYFWQSSFSFGESLQ